MQDTITAIGRHRQGTPGLVHVSSLVRVVRRSLFRAWFVPGRHRLPEPARRTAPRRAEVPATV